jgi:hypothetical protein
MTYPIDLYELMPAIHRREDVGLAYPLEALLDIVSTEVGHLQRDIAGLWDDFFIETAQEWVIPYIADLVGSRPLHPVTGSWRADVAGTISYRRRKGTLAMLEELAADVTGWGAHVVPFFETLEWAQHLDHLRRTAASAPGRVDRVGTVNVGNLDALDRLGGPFDEVARSVDVRPFGAGRGRHNIKKIGFFLWRLRSNPLAAVEPVPAASHPHGYHLSPLGNRAPIFANDRRRPGVRPAEIDPYSPTSTPQRPPGWRPPPNPRRTAAPRRSRPRLHWRRGPCRATTARKRSSASSSQSATRPGRWPTRPSRPRGSRSATSRRGGCRRSVRTSLSTRCSAG